MRPRPRARLGDWIRMDFRVKFIHDSRTFDPEISGDAGDVSNPRMMRVGVEGRITPHFEFEIDREIRHEVASAPRVRTRETNAPWRDVYGNFRYWRRFQIRAGQFQIPFGLDARHGAAHRDFTFRSLIGERLAPGRDVGVMAHARVLDRRVQYQAGIFVHDGWKAHRADDSRSGERTIAGRVAVTPIQFFKVPAVVKPRRDFGTGKGWGALEIASRYEQLRFGSAEHPGLPSRGSRAANIYSESERVATLWGELVPQPPHADSIQLDPRSDRGQAECPDSGHWNLLEQVRPRELCSVARQGREIAVFSNHLRTARWGVIGLLPAASGTVSAQVPAGLTLDDFLDSSKIQELRFDIRPSDWAQLKANCLDNTYYPVDFHWIVNGKDVMISDVAIRSRGRGSRSPVRPNLRIDFDRFDPEQKFLGVNSAVLKANNQDASMLKERSVFKLHARLGLPASRQAPCRVDINDEYLGLFLLTEEIRSEYAKRYLGEGSGDPFKYDPFPSYYFDWRPSCGKSGDMACGTDPVRWAPAPFNPEENKATCDIAPWISFIRAFNEASDTDFPTVVEKAIDPKVFLNHVAAESYVTDYDSILGDC